ncbi:hypothetical protein AM233_08970, partial [Bacillus sp. FJAT-22058]
SSTIWRDCAGEQSILISSKWILFIYRNIWVCEVFLIKLYFKSILVSFLLNELKGQDSSLNMDTFSIYIYCIRKKWRDEI